MKKDGDKIIVSDLFKEAFKMFNVSNQEDKIRMLNINELYYLLLCCFDRHDEDDPTVMDNFAKFPNEVNRIHEYYSSEIDDDILDYLNKLTTDGEIYFQKIKTTNTDLPEVYTREEVRNLKLSGILENE